MGAIKDEGFCFKYSWKKALMDYPAEVRLEVYEAIMEYAESGTLVELKPLAKMAFSIFKAEIDKEKERLKTISLKRADAGRKAMEARYSKPQQDTTNLTNANKTNNCKQELTNVTNDSKCYVCYDLLENPPVYNNINNYLDNNIQDKKETTTKVVEKKKENSAAKAAPNDIEKRKEKFYDSLVPFVGKYPKDMIRGFFDYWSEMNKSRTKMRYELERTWEVSRRLSTWASRDKRFKPISMELGTVLHDNSTDKYQNEEKWNR